MTTIKINGKDYICKYTIRAIFIWELIKKEPFAPKTTLDNFLLFYAILVANNPDNSLTWDEFMEALDNDPNILDELAKVIDDSNNMGRLLGNGEDNNDNGSKKK